MFSGTGRRTRIGSWTRPNVRESNWIRRRGSNGTAADMNEDQAALAEFNGVARLFPLPNLVLFPQALQPLHIFEPRYRQLTADALIDDRLLALVLLKPGWEQNYEQTPAIFPVACLGRIVADQLMPDGRSNLLVRGLSRVRIVESRIDPRRSN